jgi:hypothetical protein
MDTPTVETVADNWETESPKKQSRFAKFISVRDAAKEIDSGTKTRGRKPKAYTLTKPVATAVASRLFQTVGLATRCMDIWTLNSEEATAIGEASVPVFNALPEKIRTFTGEQGSRAGLALAIFQLGKVVQETVTPRIIATKLRSLENDPEYTAMTDEQIGEMFSGVFAANGRTGTNG